MTMRLMYLLAVLAKMKLLTPAGIGRLLAALFRCGTNLMTLLKLAQSTHGQKIALVDERETVCFQQLWTDSLRLSWVLKEKYGLAKSKQVGFLCQNHIALVRAIFAASGTGCDVYLLNPEMSAGQLRQLFDEVELDLLIHDEKQTATIEQAGYAGASLYSYHEHLPAINQLLGECSDWSDEELASVPVPVRSSAGKIMLLTGGTTGSAKKVPHKPSLFHYLPPFLALLSRLGLLRLNTAYIATPIYHGYGLAILLLFVALGKKTVITPGFAAAKACELIARHKVEVVSVVPLMLRKMLHHDPTALQSLVCIASGGAPLATGLVAEVSAELGDCLYNLYGTTEAGLCVIATPGDLRHRAHTIGQKIPGVRLHVRNVRNSDQRPCKAGEIGQLCVKAGGSLFFKRQAWIETGDVGYRDAAGYYYLCGRTDDMVVSAGENVYPVELARVLVEHPAIEDATVIGIPDEAFGQRLKAFVQLASHAGLTEAQLQQWLRQKVARYQMPKEIVFVEQLPYTELGKPDRKQLM